MPRKLPTGGCLEVVGGADDGVRSGGPLSSPDPASAKCRTLPKSRSLMSYVLSSHCQRCWVRIRRLGIGACATEMMSSMWHTRVRVRNGFEALSASSKVDLRPFKEHRNH